MMKYTEHSLSSPSKTSGAYRATSPTPPGDSRQVTSAQDSRISLTPLWEYVVRTKSLPEGLDLDVFFQAIQERLRNPEREVRQHALRVLTDFIPVIDTAILDEKMQIIMPDLVANLGHIGPAVRKGSIDCLRAYLNCSNNSDNILKDLIHDGLEKSHENKMKTNIVVGIIIALPFFLKKASQDSLLYIVRSLFEKMVQITYQEVTIRSLVRIKNVLGDERFDEFIKFSGTNSTRKDFDLLCEVYDVQGRNINETGTESSPYHNKNYWNDFNQNIVEESGWRSDSEVVVRERLGEIIEDKVILETEIKLNSGPAITMQIHEESRQSIAEATDSEDDGRNSMGIVKVLTDDSEEDYEPRRTPRRVRFGGEIVKLRTPDSDSNQPSDLDNDSTITITPRDGNNDKPLIEIHYTDTKTERSSSVPKSHIPIPNSKKHKTVQSEPSSPARTENKTKKRLLFRSSPNLSKTNVFSDKVPNGAGSRIPKINKTVERTPQKSNEKESSHTTTIQIRLTDFRSKSKTKHSDSKNHKQSTKKSGGNVGIRNKIPEGSKVSQPKPSEEKSKSKVDNEVSKQPQPSKEKQLKAETKQKPLPLKVTIPKSDDKNDADLSPSPLHKEVEMFHNLTRSPERKSAEPEEVAQNAININKTNSDNSVNTGNNVNTSNNKNTNNHKTGTDGTEAQNQKKTQESASKINPISVPIKKSDPSPTTNEERHLTTADDVLLNREVKKPVRSRNVRTADQINKNVVRNGAIPTATNSYNSFHVCSSTYSDSLRNYVDSPIPTNDNGDCLTCSSSGSDNVVFDSSWEDVGVVDKNIINNLNCKDDWRVRLRGLEDLNRVLQTPTSIEALEPKAASLFHFLFSCEQHIRLQSAAEDILKILFSNMKIDILQGRLNQIVVSLCKMGSPAGVRLSILLMRRISAEEFLDQLLGSTILGAKSSKIREGALQILMTISRIFPSTEVNVPKATEAVTPLLHDRKKRVRRASLETMAALAQLGTTGVVLDVISKISSNYPDHEQLMRVVRTRLSRKQLPAVDLNGSVRYSTPSGESEIEWISIGSATTSPQFLQDNSVLNNSQEINLHNTNANSCKAESAENESVNNYPIMEEVNTTISASNVQRASYWKSNIRHVESNESGVKCREENESDWSGDSGDPKVKYSTLDDDLKSQNLQIWAVDPWTLSTPVKLSPANGTLRPLYIIQREQLQTNSNSSNSPENYAEKDTNANFVQNQKRSPRGRSFSPPKRQPEYNKSEEPERFININGEERYIRNAPVGRLHKSSSSDHIRCNGKTFSPSTSSSNSGASTRNANWHKNFKSGIPVPVSSDSRLRFRTRQVEPTKGPVSIPPQFYRTKSPSPQNTPDRSIISQRAVLVRQPFSSGSESSEFYTPPAEPHLATDFTKPLEEIVLQSPRQSESFVEVDTPRYHNENFTVIDDSPPDVLEQNKAFTRVESGNSQSDYARFNTEEKAISRENLLERQDTVQTEDSFQGQDEFESEEVFQSPITFTREEKFEKEEKFERDDKFEREERFIREETFDRQETFAEDNNMYQKETPSNSLDDLDVYDTPRTFSENRSLSKSEVNLQKVPEISRKSVNSAPALNDALHHIRYETFEDSTLNSTQTSLPGSVVEFLPEKEVEQPQEVPVIHKSAAKTPRSKSLSRTNSIRASKKEVTPFPDSLRPFPKPKEGVSETLALLEHTDWEMTMKGLQGVARLTRYHPEVTEAHMHSICVGLGRHIKNLRSQVARSACLAASEMFGNHRKALEMDLEELAVPLLHRTADTNKFLRSDANAALDKMCVTMAPPRVVSVVAIKGGGHQNAIVRCAAARLLCSLTNRLGSEKIFQLPKDTRDKILFSGANMLMEGNLETRKHAKMMFGNLSSHCQFNRAMMEAVPVCTMRHIQKTLKSLQ